MQFHTLFPCLLMSLLVVGLGGCREPESPQQTTEKPVRTGPEASKTVFTPPSPLPAIGDDTSGNSNNQRSLPPPKAPDAETIASIAALVTEKPVGVGAPAYDRQVWEPLTATPQGQTLITSAEEALKQPIPELTRELWLCYERTGDRKAYQDAFSQRINRLADLALGEALEYQGRFLLAIEQNILAILNQGAWSVPAHGKDLEVFEGKRIVVDLAACQLAWSLATIDYWLADKLPQDLRARIKSEIERRVLDPYLSAVHDGRPMWWMTNPNNWMAVCVGAITGTALTLEEDPEVRAEFIACALDMLPRYIDGFSDDGISEEGINYWAFGFSHYLYASEAIRQTTKDAIDLLEDPKVFIISQSPRNLEIGDGVYAAFGDQPIHASANLFLSDFAAMRYGLPLSPSSHFDIISKGFRHPLSPQLYSLILSTFGANAPTVQYFTHTPEEEDNIALRSWFTSSEIFIFRPSDEDPDGLGLAIRVGNNGESHNHNDIGSFVVVRGGVPVLVDPGMERYTKKSFGSHRYESDMTNSFGHPVPLVANRMQKTGADAYGTVESTHMSKESDIMVIDLTHAYRSPGLVKLTRTVHYGRRTQKQDSFIEIRDQMQASKPVAFSTALVTLGEIKILSRNTVELSYKGASVFAQIDTGKQPFSFSVTPVTGFATKPSRGIKRLGIYLEEATENAFIQVRFTPDEPKIESASNES